MTISLIDLTTGLMILGSLACIWIGVYLRKKSYSAETKTQEAVTSSLTFVLEGSYKELSNIYSCYNQQDLIPVKHHNIQQHHHSSYKVSSSKRKILNSDFENYPISEMNICYS